MRWEKILNRADGIISISHADYSWFSEQYRDPKHLMLPVFHGTDEVNIGTGKGNYLLYHGNLSVAENYRVAEELILLLGGVSGLDLVVAGLNPPRFLISLADRFPNVRLVASPDQEAMDRLVRNAHIHLMMTEQATGMKLKLLQVLFTGRFVIANEAMLYGTGLRNVCTMVKDTKQVVEISRMLMDREFTLKEAEERSIKLGSSFANKANAEKLIRFIFRDS